MDQFKEKWENYWYHYKWVTIITAFFLIAGLVCLVQCAGRETYDLYLLYAGPGYQGQSQNEAFGRAIANYMDEGKKNVCFSGNVYLSEAVKKEYEENDLYINEGINLQFKSDFYDLVYAGNFNFLMLDPELYGTLEKEKLLTPIADMASDGSDYISDDGYGIRLGDTKLQDTFACFASLPADTVLCFRQRVLMQKLTGKAASEESYLYQKAVFCRVVGIA